MKKRLKRLSVIILALSMILSSQSIYAASEALYEKYEYQEEFEYEDEMIAHALKSSVVYVAHEYHARAKYEPVMLDEEAVQALIDENPYAMQEQISEYILDNYEDFFGFGREKSESIEGEAHGSGVVISEDGYVATNVHVISEFSEEDKMQLAQSLLEESMLEDLEDLSDNAEEYGITLDTETVEIFYEEMLSRIELDKEKEKLYIYLPSKSGETTKKNSRKYEAKVVEEGKAVDASVDGLTQDVAILETDEENLIALKLSDSYPEVNSNITSAGFPAAAEAVFVSVNSDKSALSVTVGDGKISRHVPIDGSDYKAMEITTTISNGSSGGPSVDDGLDIEGLNTYGNGEDLRFAYMVPAEYINELCEDMDLEQGDATKTFLTGLQMLQQGYGAAALECFEEVKDIRDDIPYIENLIDLAQEAPDEYPEYAQENFNYQIIIIIGAAALGVILLIIIVVVIVKKTKKARRAKENKEKIPEDVK